MTTADPFVLHAIKLPDTPWLIEAVRTWDNWNSLTGHFIALDQDVISASPYVDCQCQNCGDKARFTQNDLDDAEGWIECELCGGKVAP